MKVKIRPINADDLSNLSCAKEEVYKDAKRQLRKPILKAMDVYKTNVMFGEETNSLMENQSIREYKKRLLALDEGALKEIPQKIKYYM